MANKTIKIKGLSIQRVKVKKDVPIFEHDCNNCDFLGVSVDGNTVYDLYYCDTEETVIARYSNNGADYMSGMVFARPDGNKQLYEAKLRAIEKGLFKE